MIKGKAPELASGPFSLDERGNALFFVTGAPGVALSADVVLLLAYVVHRPPESPRIIGWGAVGTGVSWMSVSREKWPKGLGAAIAIVFCLASLSPGVTLTIDSGPTRVLYNPFTGAVSIDPNGLSVGVFQLISSSGVFTGAPAILPSGGLFSVDADREVGSLFSPATLELIELGPIAAAGLPHDFLLQDLTILRGSGGLGTPNRDFELARQVFLHGSPPFSIDDVATAVVGAMISYSFLAEDDIDLAEDLTWSNLVFTGPAVPNLEPVLSPAGLFEWNTKGSLSGQYMAMATVTDSDDQSSAAMLSISLIPEPSSVLLALFIAAGILMTAGRRRVD